MDPNDTFGGDQSQAVAASHPEAAAFTHPPPGWTPDRMIYPWDPNQGGVRPPVYPPGGGIYPPGGVRPPVYPPGGGGHGGVYPPGGIRPPTYPPGGGVYPPGGVRPPVYPPGGIRPPVYPPGCVYPPVYPPGGSIYPPVYPPGGGGNINIGIFPPGRGRGKWWRRRRGVGYAAEGGEMVNFNFDLFL